MNHDVEQWFRPLLESEREEQTALIGSLQNGSKSDRGQPTASNTQNVTK